MSSSWTILVLLGLTTLLTPGLTLETLRGQNGYERQLKTFQNFSVRKSVSDLINQLYGQNHGPEISSNFIDLKQFNGDSRQGRQNILTERRSYSQETRRQVQRSYEKNNAKQERKNSPIFEKRNARRNEREHGQIQEQRIFRKKDNRNDKEEFRQNKELSNDFKQKDTRRQAITADKMSSRTQINRVRRVGDSEHRQNLDTQRSELKPSSRNFNSIKRVNQNFHRMEEVSQDYERKNEERRTAYIGRNSQRRRTERHDIVKERRISRTGNGRERNTGVRSSDRDITKEEEHKRTNFVSRRTQRGSTDLQSARQRRSNIEEPVRQVETFSDSMIITRKRRIEKRAVENRRINGEREVIGTKTRTSSQRNRNGRQEEKIINRSVEVKRSSGRLQDIGNQEEATRLRRTNEISIRDNESKGTSNMMILNKRVMDITDNARKRENYSSNRLNSRRTIENNRNDMRRTISRRNENALGSFNDDSIEITENRGNWRRVDEKGEGNKRFQIIKRNRRGLSQTMFDDSNKIMSRYNKKNQRGMIATAQQRRMAEDPLTETKKERRTLMSDTEHILIREEEKNGRISQKTGTRRRLNAFEEEPKNEGKMNRENKKTKKNVENGFFSDNEILTKRNVVGYTVIREDLTGQKTEQTKNKEQIEYPLQKKMDKIMDLDILPSYDTPTMTSTVVQTISLVITVGYLARDVGAGKC